jgi:hypothetical protein
LYKKKRERHLFGLPFFHIAVDSGIGLTAVAG